MSVDPRVRARYIRDFLSAVGRLPAEQRDAVMERIPSMTLDAVKVAGALDWIDFEVNLVLTRAVCDALPEAEVHQFFRALLSTVYGTALFYPFVRSALRAYSGADPSKSARWIPGGAGLLFRDLGNWTIEAVGPERSALRVDGFPAIVDRQWFESVASSLHSLFDQIDREGRVFVERFDREEGVACLIIDWGEAPPG